MAQLAGAHVRCAFRPRLLHAPCTCRPWPALQSDAWRPAGRRHGGVTLAGHPGAVATVEATWVPLAAGSLPVPLLSLQDVAYQEVEVGLSLSGTNAITVVEAPAA